MHFAVLRNDSKHLSMQIMIENQQKLYYTCGWQTQFDTDAQHAAFTYRGLFNIEDSEEVWKSMLYLMQ